MIYWEKFAKFLRHNIHASCALFPLFLIKFTCKQQVSLETFWSDKPAVLYFMRRFGWPFCRAGARKLSALRPTMDANGVNMVAIGLEQLGAQEFVDGNFFDGGVFERERERECVCVCVFNITKLANFWLYGWSGAVWWWMGIEQVVSKMHPN